MQQLRVLMVIINVVKDDILQARHAGVNEYGSKPFTSEGQDWRALMTRLKRIAKAVWVTVGNSELSSADVPDVLQRAADPRQAQGRILLRHPHEPGRGVDPVGYGSCDGTVSTTAPFRRCR